MNPVRPVSVIICTRNRADCLEHVLRCLQSQAYPASQFEIVVVDNNSTDNTAQVVQHCADDSPVTIRYVMETSTQITLTRNRGAAAARFPYLAFIDDDCTMTPDWLAHLMSGFDLAVDVAAVGGLVRLHWEAPRPAWLGKEMEPWLADTSFLGKEARILHPDERIVEANTVFERDAWEKAGGFLGMDQFGSRNMAAGEVIYPLYMLRQQGRKIAFIPQAIAYHHVHPPRFRRLLLRSFWQGVSDVMLNHILHKPGLFPTIRQILYELAALGALMLLLVRDGLMRNIARAAFQLTRMARRTGVILTLLRLTGDWSRARTWHTPQNKQDRTTVMEEIEI